MIFDAGRALRRPTTRRCRTAARGRPRRRRCPASARRRAGSAAARRSPRPRVQSIVRPVPPRADRIVHVEQQHRARRPRRDSVAGIGDGHRLDHRRRDRCRVRRRSRRRAAARRRGATRPRRRSRTRPAGSRRRRPASQTAAASRRIARARYGSMQARAVRPEHEPERAGAALDRRRAHPRARVMPQIFTSIDDARQTSQRATSPSRPGCAPLCPLCLCVLCAGRGREQLP